MNLELAFIVVIVAVILIYAFKHLPQAIKDLKSELGK